MRETNREETHSREELAFSLRRWKAEVFPKTAFICAYAWCVCVYVCIYVAIYLIYVFIVNTYVN